VNESALPCALLTIFDHDISVPKAAVKSRALEKAVLKGIRLPAGEEEEKPWQAYAKEKNLCPVKIDYISN